MNTLLKKANKKYHALVRVWNCMYIRKRCVLINFSQLSYCPLLWNSRTLCNRVKQNSWKSCTACLQKWNISVFATEKNDLGPKIMKDIFHSIQIPYNLRNYPELQRRQNRNRKHIFTLGTESVSSLAPKIWEIIPSNIRNAN